MKLNERQPAAAGRQSVPIEYGGKSYETGPWIVREGEGGTADADPPAPGAPISADEVQKLRDTNDRLATEVETNRKKLGSLGGFYGRARSKLGLPEDATDEEVLDALDARATPAKPKRSKPNGRPAEGEEEIPVGFTEDELNAARIEARDAERADAKLQIDAESAEKTAALDALRRTRIRTWLGENAGELGIRAKSAFPLLMSPDNGMPWKVVDSDVEPYVLIVKRGKPEEGGGSEYYSKTKNKILGPMDALAELAEEHPGIKLTTPHPSTRGGRRTPVPGVRPTPPDRKNPADMTPAEKLKGAFVRK